MISKKTGPKIEALREDKHVKLSIGNKYVSRRFERLLDYEEEM